MNCSYQVTAKETLALLNTIHCPDIEHVMQKGIGSGNFIISIKTTALGGGYV